MRYVLRKIDASWVICVDGSAALTCDRLEEAVMLSSTAAAVMNAATDSTCPDAQRAEPRDSTGSA